MNDRDAVDEAMRENGMPLWGAAPFDALQSFLLPCRAAGRLPEGARSVLVAAFPYFCERAGGARVSRYAAGADYHTVAMERLRAAARGLAQRFSPCRFEPFCDSSPIPEVRAARLAGLGCVGENGLLITREYGSYVFLGELVTDLPLPCGEPGGACLRCGACAARCPSGALTPEGVDVSRCVSALTQKRGALSPQEEELLRRAGSLWGCDLCQECCPMNRGVRETEIAAFRENRIADFTEEELARPDFETAYAGRAFLWRGAQVLRRNLRILRREGAHTITAGRAGPSAPENAAEKTQSGAARAERSGVP